MTSAAEKELIESIGDSLSPTMPGEVEEEYGFEESKYEFDEDFQLKIVALFMRDMQFARRTHQLVKPEYFDSETLGFLVDVTREHFDTYGEVLADVSVVTQVLKQQFVKRRVRTDLRKEIVQMYKETRKVSLTNPEFVAEQIATFARHQAIQIASIKLIELNEKGLFDEAQKVMEKAFRVGTNTTLQRVNYAESLEQRTQKRKDIASGLIRKTGITTGYKKIDALLHHQGWGRKELSVIMGGAKKGKSMGLGQFAINAFRKGFNALYVTCEVSTEIIQDRMDANIASVPVNELSEKIMETQRQVNNVAKLPTTGRLDIIEVPSGTLTPNGLRGAIDQARGEGIIYDLIVVDYADIMQPDRFTTDPIENSKNIWLGLRAIASEQDAAVLTATQTNRQGFKSETAKAEDVAEDFNKVRIADLIISINRTDEERDRGEARLYFAASRNQGGEFTIPIKQDLETMRFITAVGAIT